MAKRHPQGVCKWRRFLGHWTATALKHWTVIDSCWKIMALSWWSPASSQLAQKLEYCLVHWSKSFHCYGHEDIGLSQLPVLRRLPVCQGLHCTTRCGRCGWQVWLRQRVSDGDVPCHAPAIFPWDQCQAVRTFSIRSWQTRRFLNGRNVDFTQHTPDQVIQAVVASWPTGASFTWQPVNEVLWRRSLHHMDTGKVHMLAPRRRPTAMCAALSSKHSPQAERGNACNQSPWPPAAMPCLRYHWGCLSGSHALMWWLACPRLTVCERCRLRDKGARGQMTK